MLEQDTIRKRRVNQNDHILLELKKEFETRDNKEYKIKVIIDNVMYENEINDQILNLYYFVLWIDYPKEKSIWEYLAIVMHFQKLINIFLQKYLEKSIATSLPLDSAPSMARWTIPKK